MAPRKKEGLLTAKRIVERLMAKKAEQAERAAITDRQRWQRRTRVLALCSSGITFRGRHLLKDLLHLLPHAKTDVKVERREPLVAINEICEMRNCSWCLFLDSKKKQDLYLWLSCVPRGPTVRFYVQNVETMGDLRLTGNCLKGSRAILCFDEQLNSEPHWQLLRDMLKNVFATPVGHPKSQPFIDHCFNFSLHDGRIWFRNYQILEEDGSLAEIGPRFVLTPIKIFEGSMCGAAIYQNPSYVSPNVYRRMIKLRAAGKYVQKQMAKRSRAERKPGLTYKMDDTDLLFADTSCAGAAADSAPKRRKRKAAASTC